MKILTNPRLRNDEARHRLHQEIQSCMRVGPEHTAAVQACDVTDDPPWLAIDYLKAPTLQELVAREGALPVRTVRWMAVRLATTLLALRDLSIVHRDIKPSNIIMDASGPKLIDFGIAKELGRSPAFTSGRKGTPGYMSPEQAIGGAALTHATDIYSLGVTIAFTATGRHPQLGANDMIARDAAGRAAFTGLPAELAGLVAHCTHQRASERITAEGIIAAATEDGPHTPAGEAGDTERRRGALTALPSRAGKVLGEYAEQATEARPQALQLPDVTVPHRVPSPPGGRGGAAVAGPARRQRLLRLAGARAGRRGARGRPGRAGPGARRGGRARAVAVRSPRPCRPDARGPSGERVLLDRVRGRVGPEHARRQRPVAGRARAVGRVRSRGRRGGGRPGRRRPQRRRARPGPGLRRRAVAVPGRGRRGGAARRPRRAGVPRFLGPSRLRPARRQRRGGLAVRRRSRDQLSARRVRRPGAVRDARRSGARRRHRPGPPPLDVPDGEGGALHPGGVRGRRLRRLRRSTPLRDRRRGRARHLDVRHGRRGPLDPLVHGGGVYFGSRDHHLYAVDARSGLERGRFTAAGWLDSSPVTDGAALFTGDWERHITAIEMRSLGAGRTA
ncbi:protein kinase [Actinomadura madurae]|nr:serine/threonine-protein kinase [Actinomadura madurae]MCQ0017456.1 protein kinase [Actinomadura madurae]